MQHGRGRPQGEAGAVPGAGREWTIEMAHPMVEDTVVRGQATYEWLEGGLYLIQRAVNDHPDFPDSVCVIGVYAEIMKSIR